MRCVRPDARKQSGERRAWLRHPYVVLTAALLLPGSGHVLNGTPTRGLVMLFYMILLGVITAQFAGSDANMLGRYAGGWFVYAVSVFDAYYTARYLWATRRSDANSSAA